ncbi:MAG: helix-turn-helix domain-containing protein [Pseudomonadota bacterium]|jgi:DNA-binding HxlR family transcriptional regulator
MATAQRSGCPINLSVEVFGDKWSLIILRDMMFGGRRHFRELLTQSEEGISSNILADRLKMLLEEGLITNTNDPTHKQRTTYSLTEKAIELVPIFALLGAWGSRHLPVSEELSIRANLLAEGGPDMWVQFMSELRDLHLNGVSGSAGSSVADMLQAAYEKVRDKTASSSRPANAITKEGQE